MFSKVARPAAEGEPTYYGVEKHPGGQSFVLMMSRYELRVLPLSRGMTADDWLDYVEDEVLPMSNKLKPCWFLYADGDSSHSRASAAPRHDELVDMLADHNFGQLAHPPARSPDFNPAENMISVCKSHTRKALRAMRRMTRNFQVDHATLIGAMDMTVSNFNKLPTHRQMLADIIADMPARMRDCIAEKGAPVR